MTVGVACRTQQASKQQSRQHLSAKKCPGCLQRGKGREEEENTGAAVDAKIWVSPLELLPEGAISGRVGTCLGRYRTGQWALDKTHFSSGTGRPGGAVGCCYFGSSWKILPNRRVGHGSSCVAVFPAVLPTWPNKVPTTPVAGSRCMVRNCRSCHVGIHGQE